jgi:hypothetical protein
MMATYIILSYLITFGMMIQSNHTFDDVTKNEYISFVLSPITLPIIIGMMIAKK